MLEGKVVNLRSLEEEDLSILKNWRNKKHVRKTTREFKLLILKIKKKGFNIINDKNLPKDIRSGIKNKN